MKILFDCNGGDYSPLEVIKGAILAKEEFGIDIAFIGNKEEVEKILKELGEKNIEVINVTEVIKNDEDPAFALRRKKDSSIVVGLSQLKEKKYDAFVSAGSTGALLAGGLFIIGRIDKIKRAVLPTSIPNPTGATLLIDSGANMDCSEELLLQFAQMGKIYLENKGIENPRVGLLNVGVEKGKGNALTKKAYELFESSNINFVGNIEARDLFLGKCDVLVCDGFVGNILLKNAEGTLGFIINLIKNEVLKSDLSTETKGRLAELIKSINRGLDYTDVGGVLLLGLNEIVVKAHGSSKALAFKNAAKAAIDAKNNKVIEKLEKTFKEE